MKEISPIEIKNMVANGEITSEEAQLLFQKTHEERGEIIAARPRKEGGFISLIKRGTGYTFNHELAYDHYLARKDFEEGIKHTIGVIFYGATGVIDGTIEGVVYMATEIEESASFLVSRSINRVRDGWQRGWNDRG